jgi:hypothetical protein
MVDDVEVRAKSDGDSKLLTGHCTSIHGIALNKPIALV